MYTPFLYDRTRPVGSFWETTVDPVEGVALAGDRTCDVAIIGGGITGLSAALHLARAGVEACVLEAGIPAWGASGRNGGFCCVGATWLDPEALLNQFGREEVGRFFRQQREGTELVCQIAQEEGIDLDAQGDGEIEVAHRPNRWRSLEAAYEFFSDIAGYPCQLWSPKALTERAYHSPEAHGALHVGVGFGLNPMKYSRGLAIALQRQPVAVYAHSPVQRWETDGRGHRLHTPGGTLRAQRVIIATNGYTEDPLHPAMSGRLLPVVSNIITTRPLTAAELAAQGWKTETPIYDTRNLLFYFRLLKDGRFLLGTRGGTRGTPQEADRYRQWMGRRLGTMFPAWRDVEISHYWSGLLCGSRALVPHVGQLADDPTLFYALAYHGNGVATATWSGRAIAHLLIGKISETDLATPFRQPLRRFPLPYLRPWYLRGMFSLYSLQDAW
ncbi:FAD-binding oxidoreductase [Thermoleptolyngbya sichuanensis XZ-Cy5]|uniref:NAD(P)/FAD-dependent oxidoreductase n=1 Tax=Thermoleptolyngbya sichuanensis TaxID=2885951 RepID=UPI00240D2E0B|nr:FAD-binding oxidoreductase [Thermoleptolyngbya sichuanensis]MDG2615864.1 FAD-binding oxidoreductase [Thermoleptolyngbya sichuanensis XZ-Cy5]